MPIQPEAFTKRIQQVIQSEADALNQAGSRMGDEAERAVRQLQSCTGRVIVTGMGKAGLIGRKIAATLNSTGSPAIYLHPAEAIHGDLGIVGSDDCLLALSNSGETTEVLALLPYARRFQVPVISISGNPTSTLAKQSDIVLDSGVTQEAAVNAPAPTSSTTVMLAIGDALAVCLMESRGFTRDDFAIYHPGGTLGKKLLLNVQDLMVSGQQLPRVGPDDVLRDVVVTMSRFGLGCAFVLDAKDQLLGIFTDGDLRRLFQAEPNPLQRKIGDVMTRSPKTIASDALAAAALREMEDVAISVMPVVDGDRCVGALHLHQLIRAGLA